MVEVPDTYTLTDFQQDAPTIIGKIKESKRPLVLTVDGCPEVVVQDAESYQALLDRLREMEDLAAIREGLAQADAGDARPAREVFAELRQKHDL